MLDFSRYGPVGLTKQLDLHIVTVYDSALRKVEVGNRRLALKQFADIIRTQIYPHVPQYCRRNLARGEFAANQIVCVNSVFVQRRFYLVIVRGLERALCKVGHLLHFALPCFQNIQIRHCSVGLFELCEIVL